jgi:hypothetical protein
MSGELGATLTAAYSFFNQSGLSSGGIIFFFRRPRPGPCGRPATIQAIAPIPGTKIIITNQAHLGRLLIEASGVRDHERGNNYRGDESEAEHLVILPSRQ